MARIRENTFVSQELAPDSETLGYRNCHDGDRQDSLPPNELFAGEFLGRALPSGMKFWRSDLTARCHHEQHATVDRSLMIRLLLSPTPTELTLDGKRRLVRPNRIFAVRTTETVNGVSRSYEGERYRCLGLFAQPEQIVDSQLAERIDTFIGQGGELSLSASPGVAMLSMELFSNCYQDDIADLLYESWALNVIARCLEKQVDGKSTPRVTSAQEQSLLRAREHINAHLSDTLSIKSLAAVAGMSMTTFKDKYRQYFEETPFETIRAARLDQAFARLMTGRTSVTEAAYRAGYRHVSSFSDAFLKRFGCRPSEN